VRTGVLDERTGIVDRCSEEASFPLSSLFEGQNCYNIKKTILRKGEADPGPDPEPENKLLLGNESEFCPYESDSDRSFTLP
jgi:hypothetical protein